MENLSLEKNLFPRSLTNLRSMKSKTSGNNDRSETEPSKKSNGKDIRSRSENWKAISLIRKIFFIVGKREKIIQYISDKIIELRKNLHEMLINKIKKYTTKKILRIKNNMIIDWQMLNVIASNEDDSEKEKEEIVWHHHRVIVMYGMNACLLSGKKRRVHCHRTHRYCPIR